MTPHPVTWPRLAASLSAHAHQVLAELAETSRDTDELAELTGRRLGSVAATARDLARRDLVTSLPGWPRCTWSITERGRLVVAARQEAAS